MRRAILFLLLFASSALGQDVPFSKGYVPLEPARRKALYAQSREAHGGRILMMAQNQDIPPAFDARTKGWVLPVGDQGNCVLPGSKVTMADGTKKKIEDVIVGDMVLGADGNAARVNWRTSREVDEEIVCISASGQSLCLTREHPVFVGGCATTPAGLLKTGDSVFMRTEKASLVMLTSVTKQKYKGLVHNLILSRNETYNVNGFCVHNCGSCYLYSTVYGTMTQALVKAGYGRPDLSFLMAVQYGMDCHSFGGCGGGNGTEVIDWCVRNGWLAEKYIDQDGKVHNDYPAYEARSRACRAVVGAKKWLVGAVWGFVSTSANRPATTMEVKTALWNYGPLNISLDAGGQFGNGTNTITRLGNNIDHEIEVIGWDDNHDNGDGTKGAFLVKNQWTTQWGNQGVRWVSYAAFQQVVDVFFVSVAALPPPPPPPPEPPTPPIPPGPIGGNSIVITLGGKSTTYLLVDPARHQADVDALDAILQRLRGRSLDLPPMPEKMPEKAPPFKLPEGPKDEKKPVEPPPEGKAKPKLPPPIDGGAVSARIREWDVEESQYERYQRVLRSLAAREKP